MRFLFLILFYPFFCFSQSTQKYPGLLWKITGNGLKKPSYLYGTMHVSNRVAWHLSDEFFDALKSVDVVGLETDPGEWLENMEKTGEIDELNQIRQPDPFQLDFYKYTFKAIFPEKRMLQAILSYDPDILNGLLYRQNKNKENFEENTYVDLFIYQSAAKLNKEVISLENFAVSEINARLSSVPDDDNGSESSANNYYTSAQKIEDAYRDGNLDVLDSLSKLGSSRNTQKYLIDDRNILFVHTIDSVLKHSSLLSGVGAAHLPGASGVIELLRKKGYTVEPVNSRVTKKSNTTRDKLDEMVKPVVLKKQVVPDSAFSIDLPGKLYPIVDIGNLKYYIHADMVNGNFYTVVRLKHLAPVFNVTADGMQAKMDSLLFENIPGKIIRKKNIKANNGTSGIEIINITRGGDQQRYQLFFTDVEMIMIKLGGKRDYAGSREANQVFGSLRFNARSTKDINFTPASGGFSVVIPSDYSYVKHKGGVAAGLIEDLFVYSRQKNQFFGVQHAVYNDFNYLEEDTFELRRFTINILDNYQFNEDKKFSFTSDQGFPAVRFHATNGRQSQFDGKLIIKGTHYYLVYQISGKDSPNELHSFDSFRIGEFNYVNPIRLITDKDFLFRVKDEITDDPLSRFNASYAKAFELSLKKNDSLKPAGGGYRAGNKLYYSPSSGEYVNINFEKYNDYDYRKVTELEKTVVQTFTLNSSMYLSGRTSSYKNGKYRFTASLKDTATARAIRLQIYFQNSTMHELSAPYDTTIGLQGWAKTFMETFEPLDSAAGTDIFRTKFPELLVDLAAKDSLRQKKAEEALGQISIHPEFAMAFISFVSGDKILKVSEESRAQLFVDGGLLKSDNIVLPYKRLYKNYTDSFYMQL